MHDLAIICVFIPILLFFGFIRKALAKWEFGLILMGTVALMSLFVWGSVYLRTHPPQLMEAKP